MMKYTIVLTEKPEGGLLVSIPALPHLTIEADSRDQAIHLACQAIGEIVSRSEIVQVDIPYPYPTVSPPNEIPWQWLGAAKDDPTWDALFDDIERNRDASRETT
jgi:predicted RNase H-like HicB family nuclease